MQKRWLAAALGAALVAGTACSSSPTAPSPVVDVGQRFEIGPGDTVAVKDAGLSLRFERVVTDSRCPGDAICITAGEAVLAFTLSRSGSPVPLSLSTASPRQHVAAGWVLILSELTPYPFASRPPIDPKDYRVTLLVDREAVPTPTP
jgi:hypothetical protein